MFPAMNNLIFSLSGQLGQALLANHSTVTTAESCTGGGIGYALTHVPGSSAWFEAGFITYSNRIKTLLLGVSSDLFDLYGAVSEPVVLAMAAGALKASGSEYAVAVSGVAGPGGGSPNKPVGTVCVAWGREGQLKVETCRFSGARQSVREQTVVFALQNLIESVNQ